MPHAFLHPRWCASAILASALFAVAHPAVAQGQPPQLFQVVSEKDTVVVALAAEDAALASDAGAVAKALRERGSMTVWRYAVRKAKDGELEQAPWAKVSLQAQGLVRVEPYRTPLRVVPLE